MTWAESIEGLRRTTVALMAVAVLAGALAVEAIAAAPAPGGG